MHGELVDPMASVRAYLAAEKSSTTRRAYEADFKAFSEWCGRVGEDPLRTSPLAVARYLSELADQKLSVSTITRRAAAIRSFHLAAGHESPTAAPGVKAVMRGIRRTLGRKVTRKAPATSSPIAAMLEHLPAELAGIRDRALLLTGFACARRRSEIVDLNVNDLDFSAAGVVVHIRRSKTDQEGEGAEIRVPRGGRFRVVEALETWLAAAHIRSGPVFRPVDRHGHVGPGRLTDRSVARIIKRAAAAAGLDADAFSGHSLRAGFVTNALELGIDFFKVMGVTGHKDPRTLKIYDRRANGFAQHAGKDFL